MSGEEKVLKGQPRTTKSTYVNPMSRFETQLKQRHQLIPKSCPQWTGQDMKEEGEVDFLEEGPE